MAGYQTLPQLNISLPHCPTSSSTALRRFLPQRIFVKMAPEDENELLRSQLKDSEEQARRAAQAGLDLLKQLDELQDRLDEQRVEMTNALEALEQDKYSLQKEVELKTRMLESLHPNTGWLFMCIQILGLQSAVEEYQLNEKQLKHKLEVQAETLNNKMEELRALNENTQSSMTSEMMEVQLKVMELENIKVELEQTLQECHYREQQLELSNSSLQRQLERITEEKEDREKEAVSWFNSLEIATLMQLQGSRADPAQLERLQSMLSEKNGEIQNLMTKLQRLEKMEVSTEQPEEFLLSLQHRTQKSLEKMNIYQVYRRCSTK
ncbi:hypothetical protein GOODEAATRI_012482 [Goodea atripinnis]|uniref:Shootin-1 n=1 Tax=Goodea atripinnis TaxID=208336 RepID=A0ABV0PXF5_9TELE